MTRILVTGGFGFIGTTLVEQLVSDGNYYVHVVDDLSTSTIDIDDYVSSLETSNNFEYTIQTVHDFFKSTINDLDMFDEIYHLASPVGPASVIHQGGEMIQMVVRDIYQIIDYCVNNETPKLVDISTSEVYGGGDADGLCSERTPKIFPPETNMRIEYALAKLAAETAIINKCEVSGLNACIVRPFNVAGQRQSARGGFVIPRFVQQIVNGLPCTVFNQGEDIRAFTHVEDIADGIRLTMWFGDNGSIYNLGNPDNKIKIKDLPLIVSDAIGMDWSIEYVDPKTIYGKYYEGANDKYPVSDKACDELGWVPKKSIGDVVKSYYDEYCRQKACGILNDDINTGN